MSVIEGSTINFTKPISVDQVLAIAYAVRRHVGKRQRMSALREVAVRIAGKRKAMAYTIVTEGAKTIREARRSLEARRSNPTLTSRP
jgi:hypothetical protein